MRDFLVDSMKKLHINLNDEKCDMFLKYYDMLVSWNEKVNLTSITDFEEVVKLDTEYINHWSIGLDIRILFKTIKAVFSKDGAL